MEIGDAQREAAPRPGTLTPAGRRIRLLAVALVLALLTIGTVWGQDSAFPFGPFRMYATRDSPNAPVSSTRVDGITATGERIAIKDSETGLRRAEIEGQQGRFVADPTRLGLVAEAYRLRNPSKPPLATVQVVVRKYVLRDGQQTGEYTDTVLAEWVAR